MSKQESEITGRILKSSTKALTRLIEIIEQEIDEIELMLEMELLAEEKANLVHFKNVILTELTLTKSSLEILRSQAHLQNSLPEEEFV